MPTQSKVTEQFLNKWPLCVKMGEIANSDLFDLGEVAFREIQSNSTFDGSLTHSCGTMIKKEKKLPKSNGLPSAKRAKCDLLTLKKGL